MRPLCRKFNSSLNRLFLSKTWTILIGASAAWQLCAVVIDKKYVAGFRCLATLVLFLHRQREHARNIIIANLKTQHCCYFVISAIVI